ncbi:MAG: bis(5'-nucleosyl)-tetraphosphatase (symmetrical) YqeK [Clostridiaceae bacterium]|nr:bis(5'-nucleosyl)-tetraphosphatase (symmetrical) YqeK [Clostridiaceae bacterium]
MIDRASVGKVLRETLSEKRLAHVLGCVQAAKELAPGFGADVEKAGDAALLHDITREISHDDQLKLCAKYGIMIDADTAADTALLHAFTGAEVARERFGVEEDIAEAIRCHTTGKAGMSPLDMTLCLADYIEPTRKFKKVDTLRALAKKNPRAALLRAFDGTIVHIVRDDGLLHPLTVIARNDLLARILREEPGVLSLKKE